MSLAREEYLCQITIVEARHLASEEASGSVDPFVKITCGNLPPQATTCETATTNPCWGQSFTFSDLKLTEYQLETFELTVEVYHFNAFLRNSLIGAYSIGLSTLHRNQGHEFYNAWLTLLHPDFGHEVRGYLQVNCFIVGAGDSPPLHQIGEKADLEEEEEEELPPELLPPGERAKLAFKKQSVQVVGAPLVARKGYQFSINIYKAENLPDSESLLGGSSPFVSVRCAGVVDRTEVSSGSQVIIWNAKISFAVFQPIFNEKIVVRVWDRMRNRSDTFIGSIPEMPGERDFFNLSSLLSKGGILACRWFNLYGNPRDEKSIFDNLKVLAGLLKKSYLGSEYHGRILISMTMVPSTRPETGVSKAAPYREPAQTMHQLQVVVYDLKSSSGLGGNISLVVKLGAMATEQIFGSQGADGNYSWGSYGESVEIKQMFPVDRTQAPDVFIELFSPSFFGGKKRIGFIRRSLIDQKDTPQWLSFTEVSTKSDVAGYSPGILLAMIRFDVEGAGRPMGLKSKPTRGIFYLYFLLYGGSNVAPALNEDDVCAFPLIRIGGKERKMDDILQVKGKHAIWQWMDMEKVELMEDLNFEQNLIVEVRNKVDKILGIFDRNAPLIGHFTVPLSKCREKETEPHMYHLVNPDMENVSQGRIMAKFYISKEPVANYAEELKFKIAMRPRVINIALLSLRNLTPSYRNPCVIVRLPGYKKEDVDIVEEIMIKNAGDGENPNIEKSLVIGPVDLPTDVFYLPILHIQIIDKSFFGSECFAFVPLYSFAKWADPKEVAAAQKMFNKNFLPQDSIEQFPVSHLLMPNEPISKTGGPASTRSYTNYEESEGDLVEEQGPKDAGLMELNTILDANAASVSKRVAFLKTSSESSNEMENAKKILEDKRKKIMSDMTSKDPELLQAKERERQEVDKQLEDLKSRIVTPADFWKIDEDEDEDAFNYHRPVKKNGTFETELKLPYEVFPLFTRTKNTEKLSLHKVGEPNGGVIKLAVSIEEERAEPMKLSSLDLSLDNLKLDLFHPILLMTGRSEELARKMTERRALATRLYIYRGLNLSAVENRPDLVARAAGMDAMSAASTYPEIIIGKGDNVDHTYICDNKLLEENELNPMYFRTYEMQCALPKEWKMEINIWSHQSLFPDQMIGRTTIDLEDRFLGIEFHSRQIMAEYLKELAAQMYEAEKDDTEKELWNKFKRDVKKYLKLYQQTPPKIPVEYRPLSHPKKKAKQGMLEMFLEVLDAGDAKKFPMEALMRPRPEDYEIRLIVWKCEGIPRGENPTVDVYFQAQFSPHGWIEESEKKETDAHLGSTDGHGVFNYRLKFGVTLPCSFPRLRLVAVDFHAFGSDNSISEIVIDMTSGFKKLMKEGSLKWEEKWVQMHLPNKAGTDGGRVLISIYIITKAEAEAKPVGEGQDEPNRDPELEKPEEGRGISDFLKGTGLDVGFGWLNFGLIAKVVALLGVLVAVAYIVIYATK